MNTEPHSLTELILKSVTHGEHVNGKRGADITHKCGECVCESSIRKQHNNWSHWTRKSSRFTWSVEGPNKAIQGGWGTLDLYSTIRSENTQWFCSDFPRKICYQIKKSSHVKCTAHKKFYDVKGKVWHFGTYIYSLSCQELDLKIYTAIMSLL